MPYPNEHSARMKSPGLYKRFRRQNNAFGQGISAIYGVRKDNNKVELQAIRFDKSKFTVAQAKKWLADHNHKPILFEPAAGKNAPETGDVGRLLFEFKAENVTDEGEFSGYGSVFGVRDLADEIVDRGAFAESLEDWGKKGKWPKMLWQHDRMELPVGVWLHMAEDDIGLRVRGKLALTPDARTEVRKARELHTLMKMGAVDSLSIGYRVLGAEPDADTPHVTHLTKLKLRDVSPVTFPCNEVASIQSVKSVRELEGFLRDAGLSRQAAKAVASRGFDGLQPRDAADDAIEQDDSLIEVADRIGELIARMRGE